MEQLVRTTLELEQYQCERCGRFFYINKMDKSYFDLSFGCPYGCDDAGKHTRTLKTEVREVIDMRWPEGGTESQSRLRLTDFS